MASSTAKTLHSRLIGTWSLVSNTAVLTSDPTNIIYPQGHSPTGLLIYTSDGYMSCQQQNPDTPRYSGPNGIQDGTIDELATAAKNYFAYSGRCFVDEERQMIWHGMTVSLIPNWIGQVPKRVVKFEEGEDGKEVLALNPEGPTVMDGEERLVTLRWKKMEENDVSQYPRD